MPVSYFYNIIIPPHHPQLRYSQSHKFMSQNQPIKAIIFFRHLYKTAAELPQQKKLRGNATLGLFFSNSIGTIDVKNYRLTRYNKTTNSLGNNIIFTAVKKYWCSRNKL